MPDVSPAPSPPGDVAGPSREPAPVRGGPRPSNPRPQLTPGVACQHVPRCGGCSRAISYVSPLAWPCALCLPASRWQVAPPGFTSARRTIPYICQPGVAAQRAVPASISFLVPFLPPHLLRSTHHASCPRPRRAPRGVHIRRTRPGKRMRPASHYPCASSAERHQRAHGLSWANMELCAGPDLGCQVRRHVSHSLLRHADGQNPDGRTFPPRVRHPSPRRNGPVSPRWHRQLHGARRRQGRYPC